MIDNIYLALLATGAVGTFAIVVFFMYIFAVGLKIDGFFGSVSERVNKGFRKLIWI